MKTLVLILFALVLAGCASLQNAGSASYSVKPFVTDHKTGAAICCEVEIRDGKERALLEVNVTKEGDNYTFSLKERDVAAFQGQGIAAGSTKAALDAAARAAVASALAPVLPALGEAGAALLK